MSVDILSGQSVTLDIEYLDDDEEAVTPDNASYTVETRHGDVVIPETTITVSGSTETLEIDGTLNIVTVREKRFVTVDYSYTIDLQTFEGVARASYVVHPR